jgi:NOL1/NOP2/fmu family ribosome biogenesis protein
MKQSKYLKEYQRFKIMNKKEKQKIVELLNQQFGIQEIKGFIIQKGQERLFLYQGSLTPKEIQDLEQTLPVERIGTYFAKLIPAQKEIRLSIEGTHLLKDQVTKNIFELSEKQAEKYLKGEELYLKPEQKGFQVMKYKNDFWGCGKASTEKVSNFIPKSRRIK